MGTSSIYKGPNKSPLLPPDFDEPNSPDPEKENISGSEKQDNPEQSDKQGNEIRKDVTWTGVKKAFSKYASGNSKNYKRAISNYVKANGGARNAARTLKSGIQSTANLGKFLNNAYSGGFGEAFRDANISFEGKSSKEIINELINYLAPVPTSKEDAVARRAIITSMEWLYQRLEEEGKDIASLDKLDKETINLIIPIQIENIINERILSDMGSRFEENSSSSSDTLRKEIEIKEYIISKVESTFKNVDFTTLNFNEKNISKMVEDLYYKCYKVMEDME